MEKKFKISIVVLNKANQYDFINLKEGYLRFNAYYYYIKKYLFIIVYKHTEQQQKFHTYEKKPGITNCIILKLEKA